MAGFTPEGKVHHSPAESTAQELRRSDRRLRALEGLVHHFQRHGMSRQAACARAYAEQVGLTHRRAAGGAG